MRRDVFFSAAPDAARAADEARDDVGVMAQRLHVGRGEQRTERGTARCTLEAPRRCVTWTRAREGWRDARARASGAPLGGSAVCQRVVRRAGLVLVSVFKLRHRGRELGRWRGGACEANSTADMAGWPTHRRVQSSDGDG